MKRGIIFILALTLVVLVQLASPQPDYFPSSYSALIVSAPLVGQINDNSGMPESFEKFRAAADNLSDQELRKEYLQREWTKILADSKLAPVLYYTDKFFSFFNPLWQYTFGMPFSWSWAFFLSIFIWVVLIIVLYVPSKNFTEFNPIATLIFSAVVASLAGASGTIAKAVEVLSAMINNIWVLGICIFIASIGVILYSKYLGDYGKVLKEESEKEELKRSKEEIKSFGRVAGKFLEED